MGVLPAVAAVAAVAVGLVAVGPTLKLDDLYPAGPRAKLSAGLGAAGFDCMD